MDALALCRYRISVTAASSRANSPLRGISVASCGRRHRALILDEPLARGLSGLCRVYDVPLSALFVLLWQLPIMIPCGRQTSSARSAFRPSLSIGLSQDGRLSPLRWIVFCINSAIGEIVKFIQVHSSHRQQRYSTRFRSSFLWSGTLKTRELTTREIRSKENSVTFTVKCQLLTSHTVVRAVTNEHASQAQATKILKNVQHHRHNNMQAM